MPQLDLFLPFTPKMLQQGWPPTVERARISQAAVKVQHAEVLQSLLREEGAAVFESLSLYLAACACVSTMGPLKIGIQWP